MCVNVWKMAIFALLWPVKSEKMADFCGFAGVLLGGGAVFLRFFVLEWVMVRRVLCVGAIKLYELKQYFIKVI